MNMEYYQISYEELCSYDNLLKAYKKARKGKTTKPYVIEFTKEIINNLQELKTELLLQSYKPRPLETFTIRDPKTRKISKSDFRDRIVHHAIINILEPIYEKTFIYDSYANRKKKGALAAIKRFDQFKRKVSKNNKRNCYILKADIKHYFKEIDNNILIEILTRKLKCQKTLWLIKQILQNPSIGGGGRIQKGMPLGNLTSQFFANVYLNELDYFIKHKLRAKHYLRYVDDFVILHHSKKQLKLWKKEINNFLGDKLKLQLHPDKSRIKKLKRGIDFLGFRIFINHRILRKRNIRSFKRKLIEYKREFDKGDLDYDEIYAGFEGFLSYIKQGDTYKLRKKLVKEFEHLFPNKISEIEVNRYIKK
jgi:RNA-directed DNA polymerase